MNEVNVNNQVFIEVFNYKNLGTVRVRFRQIRMVNYGFV